MRELLFIATLSFVFTTGCKEETTPYTEKILYQEKFDSFGNWERQPNSGGFTADSCVVVEDGLLKMTRKSGVNGCGGTWVGIIIKDTSSYVPEFLDKIGIRIKVNKGAFNQALREGSNGGFSSNLTSWLMLRYNRFWLTMPGGENLTMVHADSSLDVTSNRIDGSEFEFIYENGESLMFIDGLNASMDKIGFDAGSGESQELRIEFRVGHKPPEFTSTVTELFIDEIEIYTWCGEKNY